MKKVELVTNLGKISLELDDEKAPLSTANFCRYVESGHYQGTVFHRVISGFMVQGGGYDTSLKRKETDGPIENEAANGLKNARGTVAMARTSDINSATAQFFINVVDNRFLDHKAKTAEGYGYAVFGAVTDGMEIVDRIAQVDTSAKGPFDRDCPVEDVIIESVTVAS